MKNITKELQEVAKKYNFYFCPLSVWNTVTNTIFQLRDENNRLKKTIASNLKHRRAENTKKYKLLEDKIKRLKC